MYCQACGKEIAEDTKFCQYCGEKVATDIPVENIRKSVGIKGNKILRIIILSIFIIALLFVGNYARKKIGDKQYQKAIQYEKELAYEEAVDACGKALFLKFGDTAIEEKMSQIYIKWAERYWRMGNEEKAIALLQEAQIDTAQIQEKLDGMILSQITCETKAIIEYYDTNEKSVYERNFDERGNCLSSLSYENGTLTSRTTGEYDEYNNVVLEVMERYYDADLKTQRVLKYDYEYDAAGNLIEIAKTDSDSSNIVKKIMYDQDGTIEGYKTYNSRGKIEELAEFDSEKNVYRITSYENDTLVSENTFDKDGRMLTYYTVGNDEVREGQYTYNDNGDIAERCMYRNGILSSYYVYQYDEEGRIQSVQLYDGEGNYKSAPLLDIVRTFKGNTLEEKYPKPGDYKYDEAGNLKIFIEYDRDKNAYARTEYEYDAEGNVTVEYYYHLQDNSLSYKTEYQYDSNGSIVAEYRYNAENRLIKAILSEYKYIEL